MVSHVASAHFHRSSSANYGAGGQAIADYLSTYAGDEYAVVEVERVGCRYSLIIDPDWIRLAQTANDADHELVADMSLPRDSLIAVVAGWSQDWSNASSELSVEHSPDEIPHLRLASLRPSTTGADGTTPHR